MKISATRYFKRSFFILYGLLFCLAGENTALAQCSVSVPPVYSNSCLYEYFTSITASGPGLLTSSLSFSATSCSGTYSNFFSSQGISATIGSVVNLNISRFTTTYNAYLSVYIDQDNDGIYEPTELVGTIMPLPLSTPSAVYSFVAPGCIGLTGTPLHMRVMLSETAAGAGAPCTGNYGQACDYYFTAMCPSSVAISGTTSLCIGNTTALSSSIPCGIWSSGNTGVATVSATGVVTGVGNGTATIHYVSPSCGTGSALVTVNGAIVSGEPSICTGHTYSLIYSAPGGSWLTSNPSIATVSATGLVTGVSAGYATFSYTLSGCSSFVGMSVLATPVISGPASVACGGTAITLTSSYPGTWGSSNSSVATVTSGGVVNGLMSGTVTISCTSYGICTGSYPVTVTAPNITGSSSICQGASVTLGAGGSGGSWTSSNPSVATITSLGVVSGISTGTTTITYTNGGCSGYKSITVNPVPVIAGPYSLTCSGSGSSVTATSSTSGTWSSSNTAVATISAPVLGQINGISTGTATISCTAAGCTGTTSVSVFGPNISGSSILECGGPPGSLSASISGGAWSSSNTGVATVTSGGGVSGVSIGSATISYSLGSCTGTYLVTVGSPIITGSSSVCQGGTITLSTDISGGTWSSSNSSVASVNSGGVVSGVSVGSAIITFSVRGCTGTFAITVSSLPTISGSTSLCIHPTTTLTASISGGLWSSSNTGIATVDASGNVFPVTTGAVTITYTAPSTGCYNTFAANAYTPNIVGAPSSVCSSSPVTLSANPCCGTWSSSNLSAVNVNSSGYVTYGGTWGSSVITYSLGGCYTTTTMYGGPTPTITGGPPGSPIGYVCSGSSVGHYTANPPGGSWMTSDPFRVSIDGSGNISYAFTSSGSSSIYTVTYSTVPGCSGSWLLDVDQSPVAGCCWSSGVVNVGFSCLSSSCWGPDNISASPDYGTWTTSGINLGTISSGGGLSSTSAEPALSGSIIRTWSSGWAKYTISYSDGNACPIQWDFRP